MDLKNMAKQGAKFMAIKKGTKMTGGLLKWGAVAGLGYMGYKYFQNRNTQTAETANS